MTLATSEDPAFRFITVACWFFSTTSGFCPRNMGVSIKPCGTKELVRAWFGRGSYEPGATQFILICEFSLAAVWLMAVTAALVAQYAAQPGVPNWPKTLAAETCEVLGSR